MARTDMAAWALAVDERRYVCPAPLDRVLDDLLSSTTDTRILLLEGPGGSGKSAALREAGRRGRAAGRVVVELDGRQLAATGTRPGDLPVGGTTAAVLLLVDEVDALGGAAGNVGAALATLPATTTVAAAARRYPDGWLPDVVAPVVRRLRVPRLSLPDASELLRRHGVDDTAAQQAIGSWAGGLPLAMVLGAATWTGGSADEEATLASTAEEVITVVTGRALEQLDTELLEVAAVAGRVDDELFADVLPDRVPGSATERLASYSFVESSAAGLVLHPLVARAVATRIRDDGRPVRDLVLRIASHLRDRAARGDARSLHQLGTLTDDPKLRAGLAPALSLTLVDDDLRPDDAAEIRGWLPPDVVGLVDPWLGPPDPGARRAPTQVVRHVDGRCLAAAVALPLVEAATLVRSGDPRGALVAPLVAYADRHGLDDRVVVSPFQLTRPGALAEEPSLLAFRNANVLRRCRVVNPRHDLVNEIEWTPAEHDVLVGCGYVEVPELRRDVGGASVRGWTVDVGPGGLLDVLFGGICTEQGVDQPVSRPAGAVVLAALDGFHDDRALAALPVAPLGHGTAHAAERVRAWVRRSIATTLADAPDLADLLVRRYLDPGATHESVVRASFVSRSTYFRRLKTARDLLAAGVSDASAPATTSTSRASDR